MQRDFNITILGKVILGVHFSSKEDKQSPPPAPPGPPGYSSHMGASTELGWRPQDFSPTSESIGFRP